MSSEPNPYIKEVYHTNKRQFLQFIIGDMDSDLAETFLAHDSYNNFFTSITSIISSESSNSEDISLLMDRLCNCAKFIRTSIQHRLYHNVGPRSVDGLFDHIRSVTPQEMVDLIICGYHIPYFNTILMTHNLVLNFRICDVENIIDQGATISEDIVKICESFTKHLPVIKKIKIMGSDEGCVQGNTFFSIRCRGSDAVERSLLGDAKAEPICYNTTCFILLPKHENLISGNTIRYSRREIYPRYMSHLLTHDEINQMRGLVDIETIRRFLIALAGFDKPLYILSSRVNIEYKRPAKSARK